MVIGVAGSDGSILCQLDRVRDGLRAIGHEVTSYDDPAADAVFIGNPTFEPYIDVCRRKPTVFNVLDLATHCPEHDEIVRRLKGQLPYAGAITAISTTVANEIQVKVGLAAQTIYYPMKPVTQRTEGRAPKYPQFKVMMVGRTSDPNKRCGAAVLALVRAGYTPDQVAIVGPEYPGWGTRVGVVSDETLNDLYQSVDYVMMLSRFEGIGLSAPEGACAGAIPIVLPDLSTYDEFWASSPGHGFYRNLTSIDQIASLLTYLNQDTEAREDLRAKMTEYGNRALRPLFEPSAVASRIVNAIQSIQR